MKNRRKNIVFVVGHSDDMELSCGGLCALLNSKGYKITLIVTSASDYSNYSGKILRTSNNADKEQRNALDILGGGNIVNLGYPAKDVPYNSEIVEKLNKIFDELKPEIIITHGLNESHLSHYNTAKATLAAGRYQKSIWCFETLYPSKLHTQVFKPLIYIDISNTFNLKIKSLKAHKSQWKKYPVWNDLVTSLARLRGIEAQTKYSEAYEPIKDVREII